MNGTDTCSTVLWLFSCLKDAIRPTCTSVISRKKLAIGLDKRIRGADARSSPRKRLVLSGYPPYEPLQARQAAPALLRVVQLLQGAGGCSRRYCVIGKWSPAVSNPVADIDAAQKISHNAPQCTIRHG